MNDKGGNHIVEELSERCILDAIHHQSYNNIQCRLTLCVDIPGTIMMVLAC